MRGKARLGGKRQVAVAVVSRKLRNVRAAERGLCLKRFTPDLNRPLCPVGRPHDRLTDAPKHPSGTTYTIPPVSSYSGLPRLLFYPTPSPRAQDVFL